MANDREISLKIDGKEHRFELTLGEIEEIEDAFDKPIDEIDFSRTKTVLLLVKFAKMRENPGADPDRIMAAIRQSGVELLEEIAENAESADGERPTKPARKRAGG